MKNTILWFLGITLLMVSYISTADTAIGQSTSQQEVTDLTYLQKKEIVWSSNPIIHIELQQATLEEALVAIAKQAKAGLYYDADLLPDKTVSLESEGVPLGEVLRSILEDTKLEAYASGRNILLREKDAVDRLADIPMVSDRAMQETVRGQVTDAQTGEALPGVNILVQGTSTGTATNIDGEFELQVPSLDETLVVSYIGYQIQEIPTNGRSELNIELTPQALIGEELVVVGYGAQRRQDVISGISVLNTEDLDLMDLNTPDPANLLKGRVAGVRIQEGSGAAGTPPIIRIRGISSVNAGVDPLIVVDGFPVGTGFPTTLNPDDITNMTVLKDASATAIYGARGSNGVVLIETANAREGMSELSYNTNFSIRQLPNSWRPQMLNAEEYTIYNIERIEALDEFNNVTTPTPIPQIFLDARDAMERGELQNFDWFDEFIQEGRSTLGQNHNITYKTGNENIRGVVSGSFLDQKSALPDDDFTRLSLRTKFDVDINERINMGINLSGARSVDNRVPSDGQRSGLWAAITASPLLSPYDEEGNLIPFMPGDSPGYFARPNPIFEARETLDKQISRDLQVNIDFDVELMEGLHYAPRFYGRQLTRGTEQFKPTTIGQVSIAQPGNLFSGGPPQNNSGLIQSFEMENWGFDNLFRYNRSLGDHNFNVLLGQSIQKESGFTTQINGSIFPSDDIINYATASEITSSNSDFEWSLLAGFGQVKYNFRSKYLAEFNFRREGSSRLGVNNRYGNFPSGALGWRVSNEAFFPQDFFLNELLFKVSIGRTGNSDIGNFEALGTLGSTRGVLGDNVIEGKFITEIANQDLAWETAVQWQVGANLGMFNNSINLDVEYYKKTTKDMLFNVTPPAASGFSNTRVNIGEMENKGLDVTLNSFQELGGGIQWNSNLNVSFMSNVVTKMPPQIDRILVGARGGSNITTEGEEVGAFHGFIRLGLFDEETINDPDLHGWQDQEKIPGTNIFKDTNGDGIITRADMTMIGSPHPDVILGFNNEFAYRNFSFSMLLTSMLGYEILPWVRDVDFNQVARWNVNKMVLNRWLSPEEPGDGMVPRSEVNPGSREVMDDWLEPGDHLWIKNIRLSYSLPSQMVQSLELSQLRFFVTVDNVARFDNYSGMNPEVTGANPLMPGFDNHINPLSRTFSLGVNVTF